MVNEHLQSTWGFTCSCTICIDYRLTSKKKLKKRDTLYADIEAAQNDLSPDAAKIERLLSALSKTYSAPAHHVPRIGTGAAYMTLKDLHLERGEGFEVITTAARVLENLGYVLDGLPPSRAEFKVVKWGPFFNERLEIMALIAYAFSAVARDKYDAAREYVRTLFRCMAGEDHSFEKWFGGRQVEPNVV